MLCALNIVRKNLHLSLNVQAAEPDDPQDAVVAKQYKENYEIYRKTANHWAQTYAGGECLCIREYKLRLCVQYVLCVEHTLVHVQVIELQSFSDTLLSSSPT